MKPDNAQFEASAPQRFCYTTPELWQYRHGEMEPAFRSRIFRHLNETQCAYCRERFLTLPAHLPELAEKHGLLPTAQRLFEKLKRKPGRFCPYLKPLFAQRGQVWTTRAKSLSYDGTEGMSVPVAGPVLILWHGDRTLSLTNIVRVLPLAIGVVHNVPPLTFKLRLSKQEAFPMLAEIFNERPMLAGNLDRFLGTPSARDFHQLLAFRKSYIQGRAPAYEDNPAFERWREQEREATAYLSWSVLELLDSRQETVFEAAPKDDYRIFAIQPVRLAAEDESDRAMSGKLPAAVLELYRSDHCQLIVAQIKDRVVLSLWTDVKPPDTVYLDNRTHAFEGAAGSTVDYECDLGMAEQMPVTLGIRLTLDGKEMIFYPEFRFQAD